MLRAILLAAALAATAGCGEDSGGAGAEDLADRVRSALVADAEVAVERLGELGVDVDRDALARAELVCPRVTDPRPGDRATCTTSLGSTEVAVSVELGEGGAVTVIALDAAP